MQVKYAYTIIRSSLSKCNLGLYIAIKGIAIYIKVKNDLMHAFAVHTYVKEDTI